ncbi:hypothetical protein CW670_04045 [Macrococcoides caseolyticum]|uniref:hypothetical protein n=1 Tax=Macrococcoides caseolyticum TaxID=69966 RepID=UPI000C341DBA|nr:hypothetical protein [Macrococcus caseolyticus]PKE36334.1 hypothetical protein CW695_03025 [Macrococcus caseolyticus]PKE74891.1 hypothetical protein CW670_04045 [Macrococcus caseolyticus]
MKFVIAELSFFERLGYNTKYWRKNKEENKTICHLEFAEILAHDLHNNSKAQIVDVSEAQDIMNTEEWSWTE